MTHDAPPVPDAARRPRAARSLSFGTLKRLSFAHSTVYAILLIVWLVPGLHPLEFVFGMAHGLGWIAMCCLMLAAVRARVVPLRLGVAVAVPADARTPGAIRAAVRRVLADPRYRERAAAVQAEMRALPDLAFAADRLERLAR